MLLSYWRRLTPGQCCFTSTKTVRTIRGVRGVQEGHLDFQSDVSWAQRFTAYCYRSNSSPHLIFLKALFILIWNSVLQRIRVYYSPPPPPLNIWKKEEEKNRKEEEKKKRNKEEKRKRKKENIFKPTISTKKGMLNPKWFMDGANVWCFYKSFFTPVRGNVFTKSLVGSSTWRIYEY